MTSTINLFTLLNLIQDYYGSRFKQNCRVSMLPHRAAPSNVHVGRWVRYVEPKKVDDSNVALIIVLPFDDEDHCSGTMGQVTLDHDDMVKTAEEVFGEIKSFEVPMQDLVEPFCFLPSHYETVCKTLETLAHSYDTVLPPDPSFAEREKIVRKTGLSINQYVHEIMHWQDQLRKSLEAYSPRYYKASDQTKKQLISPSDVQQFITASNSFVGTVLIAMRK